MAYPDLLAPNHSCFDFLRLGRVYDSFLFRLRLSLFVENFPLYILVVVGYLLLGLVDLFDDFILINIHFYVIYTLVILGVLDVFLNHIESAVVFVIFSDIRHLG